MCNNPEIFSAGQIKLKVKSAMEKALAQEE
jgi:hypothetical protein